MRAEAGYAARAVGRAAHPLIQQPPIPQRLQNPPAGFNIIVFQRDIRVVHIHPETDAVGHRFPLFNVAENAFAAFPVKRLDAVLLDFALAGQPQFLLHAQLHRQPMGIPPPFAPDLIPFHRPIAADDILENPRQHMVDPRTAVSRRRPIVQHKARRPRPLRSGAAKNIALLPLPQNAGIQFGKADTAGNELEHKAMTIWQK